MTNCRNTFFFKEKKLNLDFKGKTGPFESLCITRDAPARKTKGSESNLLGKGSHKRVGAAPSVSWLCLCLLSSRRSNHRGTAAPEHFVMPGHKPGIRCCSLIPYLTTSKSRCQRTRITTTIIPKPLNSYVVVYYCYCMGNDLFTIQGVKSKVPLCSPVECEIAIDEFSDLM